MTKYVPKDYEFYSQDINLIELIRSLFRRWHIASIYLFIAIAMAIIYEEKPEAQGIVKARLNEGPRVATVDKDGLIMQANIVNAEGIKSKIDQVLSQRLKRYTINRTAEHEDYVIYTLQTSARNKKDLEAAIKIISSSIKSDLLKREMYYGKTILPPYNQKWLTTELKTAEQQLSSKKAITFIALGILAYFLHALYLEYKEDKVYSMSEIQSIMNNRVRAVYSLNPGRDDASYAELVLLAASLDSTLRWYITSIGQTNHQILFIETQLKELGVELTHIEEIRVKPQEYTRLMKPSGLIVVISRGAVTRKDLEVFGRLTREARMIRDIAITLLK